MNFHLPGLPAREAKPRKAGFTMVMDKGLALQEADNFLSVAAEYTDFVKLGWCTAILTPRLEEKLNLYRDAGMAVYFGGTLFEAYVARGLFDDFRRLLDTYKMQHVEVSDGSLVLEQEEKAKYIRDLSKDFFVLSEVGSKDASREMAPYKWIQAIKMEIDAGSKIVVTEARESGTVGVYHPSGEVRSGLIDEILHALPHEQLLFEAPRKEQQVFFIKLLGANVSLGNVAPAEVIGLETIRLGLRGDTFHTFLPNGLPNGKK